MSKAPTTVVPRLIAFAIDSLITLAWGGVIFGIVMLATAGSLQPNAGPWTAHAISLGFATPH